MTAAAGKAELRERFGSARRAMSDATRTAARRAICSVALDRCRDQRWGCVAAYVPLRSEPGSFELLDGLAALGVRVLVPVTLPDRDLDWTQWGSDVPLGVSAVGDAEAVLVPALAAAVSDGTRLGRGGGSYDRALLRCAAGADIAALLFDGELVQRLPAQAWDRPVHTVVTPAGWQALAGNTAVPRPG